MATGVTFLAYGWFSAGLWIWLHSDSGPENKVYRPLYNPRYGS